MVQESYRKWITILMCLRVNRILKEGKREGWLGKKLFQRLWPWVDTTWEWVDARTKESWQWDYLLAKKLFSDDVLTSRVRRLGSHYRRKPMSCMAHGASTREAALKPCILSMRWFAGDGLGTQLSGQQHRPRSCWPHPPSAWQLQSGGCCLPWTAHGNVPELFQDP